MGCLEIKEAMFANCILFATFCSMGTLVRRKTNMALSARKVMEFGHLMIDILVYVSCDFEMYIFKIGQVISENVRIAFLYVLCKHTTRTATNRLRTPTNTSESIKMQLRYLRMHYELVTN